MDADDIEAKKLVIPSALASLDAGIAVPFATNRLFYLSCTRGPGKLCDCPRDGAKIMQLSA